MTSDPDGSTPEIYVTQDTKSDLKYLSNIIGLGVMKFNETQSVSESGKACSRSN